MEKCRHREVDTSNTPRSEEQGRQRCQCFALQGDALGSSSNYLTSHHKPYAPVLPLLEVLGHGRLPVGRLKDGGEGIGGGARMLADEREASEYGRLPCCSKHASASSAWLQQIVVDPRNWW